MCDPLTIGGMALTGVSMAANSVADASRRRAADDATGRAAMADMMFQQRSAAINNASRERFADFGGKQEAKAQELGDYFKQQGEGAGSAPSATPVQPTEGGGKGIIANERAKQTGLARAHTGQQGEALGSLRAFDSTMGDANRGLARDAGALDQNLNFQRGTMNLLPGQLAEAQRAGGMAALFGDLARGGGRIMTGAGMMRPLNTTSLTAAPFSDSLVPNSIPRMFNSAGSNLYDLFGGR
jgi:hypothetical protein